jgi:hypothetical protein
MSGLEIIIVTLLLLILFVLLTGHIFIISQPTRTVLPNLQPINPVSKKNNIGGCEGTRYGCCAYSQIPKLNEIGSNCQYQ